MSDRMTTVWGALGALFVLALLFYPSEPQDKSSRPTTLEAGPNGYFALYNWLVRSDVEVRSVRKRLESFLAGSDTASVGNVMFTTLPHSKPQRHSDHRALRRWIEEGNTLVVLAALNDTPDWTVVVGAHPAHEIYHLFDVDFEAQDYEEAPQGGEVQGSTNEDDSAASWWEPFALSLTPYSMHPLMHGVEELRGHSDLYADVWRADFQNSNEFPLRLARQDEVDAIWQLSYGKGRVVISASATLLSNQMLGEADNAQFVANLLSAYLAADGAVLFDDFHQGISDLYDPDAFFSDRRLHKSVVFLVALWLFYLLADAARLGPLREPLVCSQQTSLISATAVLMSRKLEPAEAGRAMVNQWLFELQESGQLHYRKAGAPPWEQLAEMPLVDKALLASIRDSYSRLGSGQKVDLKKLHNTIQTVKRNMA